MTFYNTAHDFQCNFTVCDTNKIPKSQLASANERKYDNGNQGSSNWAFLEVRINTLFKKNTEYIQGPLLKLMFGDNGIIHTDVEPSK